MKDFIKSLTLNSNKYLEKAHKYLAYALFFILPFSDKIQPLFIVVWASLWVLYRIFIKEEKQLKLDRYQKRGLLLFSMWVIWSFVSIAFTAEKNTSLIERRLMFILLPLILLVGESKIINKRNAARALLLGSIIAILFYTIPLIFTFNDLNISSQDFRNYLIKYKHPAYLSLILNLTFFINVIKVKDWKAKNAISFIIIYLLFGLYIYLIRSRAGILGFGLMSLLTLIDLLLKTKNKQWLFLLTPCVLALLAFSIIGNEKFSEVFSSTQVNGKPLAREILWQSSVDLLKVKPVFGYGYGGAEKLLIEQSYKNGLTQAYDLELNAHNQFLQSALDNGILGMFLIFISLFYIWKGSTNKREASGILFIIFMAFMFESMLLRIAGVAVFSCMLYLLVLSDSKELNDNNSKTKRDYWFLIAIIPLIFIVSSQLVNVFGLEKTITSSKPSTFAFGKYKTLKSLPGIVPEELNNVYGYKLDYTATTWQDFDHLSITNILNLAPNTCDSITFSTWCYVSSDFDGNKVFIAVSGNNYGTQKYYDTSKKETWQLLSFSKVGANVKSNLNLYVSMKENEKLSDMNGYVIFALPEYKIYKDGIVIKETK